MCIHEVHAQKHKHARCIYDWSHIFAGLSLNFDRPGSRRVISPSSCTGAHSRVAGRSRRTRFVRDERNGPMKDTELAGQGAAAWPAGRRTRPETKRAGPAGNGAGPTGNGAGFLGKQPGQFVRPPAAHRHQPARAYDSRLSVAICKLSWERVIDHGNRPHL